ncbi:unnamed protein product [Schistocephalus solidus]|uniref:Myb-like domain-containing protein n=1 Tax=Schistocephalus solidus TaxID=70667 RepID=A0A183T1Y9_SCHSO|nr:unnamed protein product [Schistocephalus solidus]
MELHLGASDPIQPNIEQAIALVPPDDVEVTRISAAVKGLCKHENQLHIRLHLPGLRKPANELKLGKSSTGSKWTSRFLACVRARDDQLPASQARSRKGSSLRQKKPDAISVRATDPHEEFLQESKNGEWIRAPDIQQPSNGQIWLRATGLRIYLLVLVCATESYPQSDEGEVDRSSRASLSSMLQSSEGSVSSASFGAIFPYSYFYWESRKLMRKFDIQRSKMTVVDDYIHLLLVPLGNAVWTDEDLQSIQQSAESTRVPETGETEDTTTGHNRSAQFKDTKEDEGAAEPADVSEQPCVEQNERNMCTESITTEAKPDTKESARLVLDQASSKEEAKASSDNVNTSIHPDLQTAEPETPGSKALSASNVALQSGVCGDQAVSQDVQDPTTTSNAQQASSEKFSPPAVRCVSRQTSPVFCGGDRSDSASFNQSLNLKDNGLSEKDSRQNRNCHRSTGQLLKSRIPMITRVRPKIADKAVGNEESEEENTMRMTMMPGSMAASSSTRHRVSSRIPFLKRSTLHRVPGDPSNLESNAQIPPLPSDARSRSPRQSRAAKCVPADREVCALTERSRPLRKPRKKAERTDDEDGEPVANRDAKMTARRRRTKYRTRTLETADFSRELHGLDVIRSKLENMTDDQWNRVLAILSGNTGDGSPPSLPPHPDPPILKDSEVISPWPRRPRGFSPACIERAAEYNDIEPPRGLVRKRERRRNGVGEGTHRNRVHEEGAERREEQYEGIRPDREHANCSMPSVDLLLAQKPPHPQEQHPVRRTRDVHRRRERAEGDLPNYFYRARTEMQAEKIFGKH